MKKKNTCLVIFNSSWGEIDFMLPMIKFLSEKNINIISIFRNEKIYYEKKNYQDLFQILDKHSKILNKEKNINYKKFKIKNFISVFTNYSFLIQKLKKFKFKNIKNYFQNIQKDNSEIFIKKIKEKYKVDYILCGDFDANYQLWINSFRRTKFLLFPHAITIRGTDFEKFRNIEINFNNTDVIIRMENLKRFPPKTVLFGCDDDEIQYFKYFTSNNIILKKIGFARLSNSWISYHKKINKKKLTNNLSKNLFLLLIGKVTYIGKKELDKKIKEVIKIADKINYNIIVKNHPRNNLNLKKYNLINKNVKIYETNQSLHGTLKHVEFVIMTSKSGVCLDCIAQGKIPIEFYKYDGNNKKNRFYEFKINNEVTSIYKYKKLTYSFDDNIELNNFIEKIVKNKSLKRNYYNNMRMKYLNVIKNSDKNFKNFASLFVK